jgi:hypothetical protein
MSLICPKCGLEVAGSEGKSVSEHLCEHCGQPIGPLQDAEDSTPLAKPMHSCRQTRFTWPEVVTIVAIVAVLIGLMLPAVQSGPRASRRNQCLNNQRQITLALFAYHNDKGCFPPAYVADENGKPMHSWRVLILPYLDRTDLFQAYDFKEPWDGPHNRLLADKMPSVFACPSNPDAPNCTGYALLVGPHAFSSGPTGRTIDEISSADGAATTLMLVEAANAKINWLEPRDLNVEEMSFVINKSSQEITSHHAGAAVVSYCDGRTSTQPFDIKPEALKALTTVDGHEQMDENSF